MRPLTLLLLWTLLAVAGPAAAQQGNTNLPVSPDASAVPEHQLLNEEARIQGRIDIPDAKSAVLEQPTGRKWDYFHEVILRWFGTIALIGTLIILAVAYFVLGRLRISAGRSGQKIARFSGLERFSHWLTAVSFVILALTGLNITFGKLLLLPLIGPESFSAFSQISKYIHNFVSFAFVVGLALVVSLFFKDNIPRKVDVEWFKQGGGFIKSRHAPAGRFNGGEKLVYWFALGGGIAVIATGLLLLFPFYWTNIFGMQVAQVIHAVVAVLFVALILGHIYVGTLGTEGAFEAMGSGEVDRNWAKEHHDQWFDEVIARENSPDQRLRR
jgi:formate dehydrogenase subunit gamma